MTGLGSPEWQEWHARREQMQKEKRDRFIAARAALDAELHEDFLQRRHAATTRSPEDDE